MWKLLNIKFDRRTAYNMAKLPLIIFLRIPIALFFIGISYLLNNWSEVINDKLPGWHSYPRKGD